VIPGHLHGLLTCSRLNHRQHLSAGRAGGIEQSAQNFSWLVGHMTGPAAFAVYGIGGLVVPLALLFLWLRLRTNTAAAAHDS
jgi:hypothetical protein